MNGLGMTEISYVALGLLGGVLLMPLIKVIVEGGAEAGITLLEKATGVDKDEQSTTKKCG